MKKNFARSAWKLQTRRKPRYLRFTPTAWGKLLYLRDRGETEVGGFGVSSPSDLLLLEDIRLVKQSCSPVSVKFDDHSVADYFDAMIDQGYGPESFGRIWIHTHPGDSPEPSPTDERTFRRCFGDCDWSVMFIVAEDDSTYGRLRFVAGPGGSQRLFTDIDYRFPFAGSNIESWEEEYTANVVAETLPPIPSKGSTRYFPSEQMDALYLPEVPWIKE